MSGSVSLLAPDSLTNSGAQQQASGIEAYWLRRGFMGIKTRIEYVEHGKGKVIACVRSNIGAGGYPPKQEDDHG